MSSISAGTTSGTALVSTGDTTGTLDLKTGASATTALSIDASQNITFTNQPTYTGGTANGVLYLNGSKVATSGTALVFDGTNLGIGTSSPGYKLDVNGFSRFTNGFYLNEATAGTNAAFYLNSNQTLELEAFGANGAIAFSTGSSNIERMLIDSSGNVGIGGSPSTATRTTVQNCGSPVGYWVSSGVMQLQANAVYNSGDKFIGTGYALYYAQDPSTGAHVWSTSSASGTAGNAVTYTERMRIDSSGNVGIGTSSPSTYAGANGTFVVYGGVSTTFTNNPSNITLINNGTIAAGLGTGIIFGANYDNSFTTTYAIISGIRENATSGSPAGALVFGTRDSAGSTTTERARIDSSGNLLVGTTSAGGKVSISSIGGSQGTSLFIDGWGSGIGSAAVFIAANTSNSDVMYFNTSAGNVGKISITSTATSYVTSSDYRLKENIQPMTGALAKVAALKPVTYKWKADGSDGEGFIAHELAEVCPQAVTGEKDAVDNEGNPLYQGVDTSFLVATLTAAIQELSAKNDELTARIAALESK